MTPRGTCFLFAVCTVAAFAVGSHLPAPQPPKRVNMAYRFAQRTKVPANQSRNEIEKLLAKAGASGFIYGTISDKAMVGFELQGWRLRFMLPLPQKSRSMTENQVAAETRRRWRALLLVLKAKLEAVNSGIVEFQREFLPFIVVRGHETVGDQMLPSLAGHIAAGELPPLLGAGS